MASLSIPDESKSKAQLLQEIANLSADLALVRRQLAEENAIGRLQSSGLILANQIELLQNLVYNVPVLLVIWDPQLQRFTLNPYAETVLGWTIADANQGDFISKVYPDPDYRARVVEYMQSVEPGWREWFCTTKNGSSVPIKWANSRLIDGTIVGIGVDLHERKSALESLRISEEKYRTLFDSIKEGFCIVEAIFDEDGKGIDHRFIEVNPAFERHTGLHEAVGKTALELVPDLESKWPERYGRIAATGKAEHFIDDSLAMGRWFEVDCFRVGNPEEKRVALLFTDITERKQAEEALEKIRFMLSEGQMIAKVGSFEYIAETGATVWSDEECRIYGIPHGTPSPAYEVMLSKFIHPEDAALLHETFTAAKNSGSVYELEHRIVRPDGIVRVVYDRAHPYFDENGKLVRYVGATLDITDRKHAEEALRESELRCREMYEEMRALFAAMTDLVFILDSEGRYLKIVDTSPSLLYKSSNELLGRTLHEVFPKEHADFFLSHLMQALSTQQSVNFEYSLFIGNQEYWFNATVSPISDEKILMVARDITERKQAEEILRESEEKFRTVFEQAAIGIGRVSFDDACWIEVNDTFCRMLGYTRDEMTSMPWTQITYPEDIDLDLIPFRRMAAGELESYSVEKRFIHKQGHHEWARLTLSLVRDAKGLPDYEIAVIEDINKRKQSEEALRQFTERLEEMVAERSALAESKTKQLQALAIELIETEERERRQFAQLLHDDLQQMLAAAKMQVQVVAESRGSEPMLSSAVQLLEESIAKSRRLSHQLSPAILHQAGLVVSLEWLSRQMKEQFDLLVDLQLNTGLLMERTPQKVFLFRAVQELLFNIVKHSGVKRAKVEVTSSEDSITVTVSDQGSGFDSQILEKRIGNLGLGLLTIKERASHIGGAFTIESAPGKGSRFSLMVPNAAADDAEKAATQALAIMEPKPSRSGTIKSAEDGTRVLFVDDHRVLRQGLINLLKGQPAICVVGEASNGREALEQARKLQPDVIVMDISMPEMDGIKATRSIKAEMPLVRIIGLTMHDDPQLTDAMQQAGAELTLSKTTSAAELVKAIYGRQQDVD
jgi:PAS domain S-box-containing protein